MSVCFGNLVELLCLCMAKDYNVLGYLKKRKPNTQLIEFLWESLSEDCNVLYHEDLIRK